MAFGQMGLALGVVLSLTVLFTFTVKLEPILAWGILSLILISFALLTLTIVSEPPEGIKREPFLKKFKILARRTF